MSTEDASSPTPDAERAGLEELVRRCRGNISAVARERSVTRQAITRRLEKHGLLGLVSELAVGAGVSGRRRKGGGQTEAHAIERERILDALAAAPNYDAAVEPLGIPRRTLFNRIARYKITPELVAERRQRNERRAKRRPRK